MFSLTACEGLSGTLMLPMRPIIGFDLRASGEEAALELLLSGLDGMEDGMLLEVVTVDIRGDGQQEEVSLVSMESKESQSLVVDSPLGKRLFT